MSHSECETCGRRFSYMPVHFEGRERFRPRTCPACHEAEAAARQRMACLQRQRRLEAAWESICPPLYRDTDTEHPAINPQLLAGLLRYEPNGRGIGLYGPTGRAKTRMMYLLLRKLHFAGHRVYACSARRLSYYFATQWGSDREANHARQAVRCCYTAEVLLVDDLGKQRFTPAAEAELYDLIETRTSHLRPILWTANATGSTLASMMSPDRGTPIVRRLEEFCEVLGV